MNKSYRCFIGEAIKEQRIQQGLSQEVLSGLAGIARTHLTMIENGKKEPCIDTILKISSALGIPLSCLFQIVEQKIYYEEHHRKAI